MIPQHIKDFAQTIAARTGVPYKEVIEIIISYGFFMLSVTPAISFFHTEEDFENSNLYKVINCMNKMSANNEFNKIENLKNETP